MKWTVANSSDLADSWNARDIIVKKESEGYCCHICHQVKVGKSHAQFWTEKNRVVQAYHSVIGWKNAPVCSEECRQKMLKEGFDEVSSDERRP